MQKQKTRLSVTIPLEYLKGLTDLAEDENSSISALVAEATVKHLFQTVWSFTKEPITELLKKNFTNEQVLLTIKDKFPHLPIGFEAIAYLRKQLRQELGSKAISTDRHAKSLYC